MYEKFKELDGTHPWRDVSADGYLDYRARYRPKGRVLYFNFPLAREMELIPPDHPPTLNKELEQVILEPSQVNLSLGVTKPRVEFKNFWPLVRQHYARV